MSRVSKMSVMPIATARWEPVWEEQWVPLDAIIKHAPWQVRVKLDSSAVKRYADMTRAGSLPPPVKLGLVKGKLYLLDGWHRMAAGALQTNLGCEGEEALAQVAKLDEKQARWVAAEANLSHGVQYQARDLHGVFKAFVKAKLHIGPDGSMLSYREIAPFIGKPHTTIRTWMLRYFPKIASAMGGKEYGNPDAEQPPLADLADEHRQEALEAILNVTQRLPLLTSKGRWELAKHLEQALQATRGLGIEEPDTEDF